MNVIRAAIHLLSGSERWTFRFAILVILLSNSLLVRADGFIDEPPPLPFELVAEPAGNWIEVEIPSDDFDLSPSLEAWVSYQVAPPEPPSELLIDFPTAAGVVPDDAHPSGLSAAEFLAGARMFSIARLPTAEGLGAEGPGSEATTHNAAAGSRIRFAGTSDPALRVFEFTAVDGSVESIDSSILQLPRMYRVAEVKRIGTATGAEPSHARRAVPASTRRRISRRAEEDVSPPVNPNDKLAAMGFPPLSSLSVDTSIQENPQASWSSDQSAVDAATRFREFGSYHDIPRIGDIGLDANFILEPADFCHQPLYFEEINLERFGTTCAPRLQPALSGARFFVTVPALPYLMTVQRPRCCYYDMSPYRPGRPAPWHRELPPLKLTAATVEAAVIAGMILVIP